MEPLDCKVAETIEITSEEKICSHQKYKESAAEIIVSPFLKQNVHLKGDSKQEASGLYR